MVEENVAQKQETMVMTTPDMKVPIDIIIPHHNNGIWGLELVMGCIKNLFLYTQLPFHIIVVDDSTDLSKLWFTRLLKEKNNVTYVHSDTPYTCGNQVFNIGLSHCKREFVATVMNSVTVQPDWELVAVEMLKRDPKIATIGLKCLLPWGTLESCGIQMVKAMDYGGIHVAGVFPTDIGANFPAHLLSHSYVRDAVQWAFAIHRREALVGNLEENIYHGFLGWDDIDNCYVLRKKGWKVFYCGSGSGYHLPRATRGVEETDQGRLKLNHENGEIFRKRWNFGDGDKPAEEIKQTEVVPMNRAERRRLEKAGKT